MGSQRVPLSEKKINLCREMKNQILLILTLNYREKISSGLSNPTTQIFSRDKDFKIAQITRNTSTLLF